MRYLLGAIRNDDVSCLTDADIMLYFTTFACTALGPGAEKLAASDYDAVFAIEGVHQPVTRKLGIVTVAYTNGLAYQDSITAFRKKKPDLRGTSSAKVSISLAIGSAHFGMAHTTFFALTLPLESKAVARRIITDFESFQEGEFAWLDTNDPLQPYRDRMSRLLQAG